MSLQACAVSLCNWKDNGKLRKDTKLVFDIIKRLDPLIMTDGRVIDRETELLIKPNHLRCMLRREYIENGGELRGRSLNLLLTKFMEGLVNIAKDIHSGKLAESERTGKALKELAASIPEPTQYLPS